MKVEPVSFIERQYKEMFLNLIYIQHTFILNTNIIIH